VYQGPFVKEFEDLWCEFTGAKHSVAVTSCTTALHLSLDALGISAGDEVIVPAFTWIATANAVEYLKAVPVFCDIDTNTFNIDVNKIASKITSRTKAIIPVHLFGLPVDLTQIKIICDERNIKIIEDSACGFGSRYGGIHVGTIGNTGCFSFHPRKAITTGEGGMITTNDSALAELLRSKRDHGASISDLQRQKGSKPYLLPDFPNLGYNFRMTDIQASIGCTQMKRAESIISARIEIANKYDLFLKDISWLRPSEFDRSNVHSYQSYVCLFVPFELTNNNFEKAGSMRNDFMDYLNEKGISTRPGTHAVHNLGYYRSKYKIEPLDYANAMIADKCSIAFPLYPGLSELEFNYIKDAIQSYKIPVK